MVLLSQCTTILLSCLLATASWLPSAQAFKGMPVTFHEYQYSGENNNPENPTFGIAGTPRVRQMPPGRGAFLDDAGNTPFSEENSDLPSARRIMEELFRKPIPTQTSALRCELLLYFGLLIQVDTMKMGSNSSEPFHIPCDGQLEDAMFCPATGNSYCASNGGYDTTSPPPAQTNVFRAEHEIVDGQRATMNGNTAFLDMSFLYGGSKDQADKIRSFVGGQLDLVDNGAGLLPRDSTVLSHMNTLPTLYSLIVVFMRFHNYVAKYTMEENPNFTDEQIYNSARNYVIGTYQKMVLNNYFPAITGDTLGVYRGYDPSVNPAVDEFFATVSYRYAHTEQPSVIRLMDPNYVPTAADPIFLRDAFTPKQPDGIAKMVTDLSEGIENVLRGATFTPKKPYDTYFVDDLNLFTPTTVLDIQRSRDVGIPPYNEVRRRMGLKPAESIYELVMSNKFGISYEDSSELVAILQNLYNDDVEKVDAYVGALFEGADESTGTFGPLFDNSFKDQFNRIRLGDRFWFENVFSEEEQSGMLTLTDIIKLVCDGMNRFPWDPFAVWGTDMNKVVEEDCDEPTQLNKVSLLGGGYTMAWAIFPPDPTAEQDSGEEPGRTVEVTLTAEEGFDGVGFMGVGWRARTMNGADIWFCTIDPENFVVTPGSCDSRQTEPFAFNCCVARGANVMPNCLGLSDPDFYPLQVVDWCLDADQSSVTIRADVCAGDDVGGKTRNCFQSSSNGDGTMNMIAAYNPSRVRPHGFQRRTSTVVDLKAGIQTADEGNVAQEGLIAYHAITMLVFWMFLAPIGIFVARYMKTKTWRLVTHISIMGAVAGLMIPILIGVEASVGATDKSQEHAVVGLGLTAVVLPMFLAGRIRLLKLQGVKVGRRTARIAFAFHKYTGYFILFASWYNCYAGLIRISPEDSNLQLVLFSSVSLGYDFPIFGFIKDHLFVPYVALICLTFLAAEIHKLRLNGAFHEKKLKEVKEGKSIWDDQDEVDLYDEMTMDKFLDLTRLGSNLCIIDGRVLDISGFVDSHPGGRDMLKTVAGSDITDEIAGLRDIEGFRHAHSYFALQRMKTLVIAVLVAEDLEKYKPILISSAILAGNTNVQDTENPVQTVQINSMPVFRRARILDVRFITPFEEISDVNKPVIMLCLAVPKVAGCIISNDGFILPSACFKFRVVNAWGSTFEAYYTPVRLLKDGVDRGARSSVSVKEDENVYEFLISLRPGGQISKASLEWKIGKALAVQGPSVNPKVLQSLVSITSSTVMTLFAAGTGIAPMLQLLDFYTEPSRRSSTPNIFLIWVLKGPEHNYSDWLGFEERAKQLQGKFKWIIIYSSSNSSDKNKTQRTSHTTSRKDANSGSLRESAIAPSSIRNRVSRKGKGDSSASAPRSNRFSLAKSLRKESSDTKISSVAVPSKYASSVAASNGLKLFKGRNRGSLIERIRNHDPTAFTPTKADAGVSFSPDLKFDDDFWRVHANKALCLQLDEPLVSNILASIDYYFEIETARDCAKAVTEAHQKSDAGRRHDSSHTSETEGTKTKEKMLADEVADAFRDSGHSTVSCAPEEIKFFLCGSPRFDSNVRDWLESKGCDTDSIHNFYASPNVHI
ncbi:unnamed protein product [Cylindrotheca closterium]|uniref:Cytochrome b5 heme-binding domain-containing protein n=1 Tax=Cylindrotheca closterium TaxID=2856 RepID=A0AAD2G1Y6_9STRA|nr:unnamed protein product [Cylindrotheca closterium]